MTQIETLSSVALSSPRFKRILGRIARASVLSDLPAVAGAQESLPSDPDWNFAILCCSALTGSSDHQAQDAVLRVTQACLVGDSEGGRREAAAVLLERLGNRPALRLAAGRGLIPDESWTDTPAPLQLDVIRRRLELTILAHGREVITANIFQRDFWTAAGSNEWLSVSAPTSAGKSFIVKRWMEEQARTRESFIGVYVVPTRALIEEVSGDLRADFGTAVAVHTLPWDAEVGSAAKEVYVLTQERLHLLQQRLPAFAPDIVFVDEAQKFGDGTRGVLLQQVIDEAIRRAPASQLIFASPLSENPELLLDGAPTTSASASLTSGMVTVNQNLLWANQVYGKPRQWQLRLILDGEPSEVGHFELTARPSPESKRLPLVAVALGGSRSGNVVYVNGAAEAEKTARQIYEALGEASDLSAVPEIAALRELSGTAVHPQFALQTVLARGVAFHYGNMPQLLRSEIERLFREGVLRYLVCTSTLLEGVNLPCRNLFVRGPRKGNGNKMTLADFWNLAGRAGRWGKEFQGNIVCVDTTNTDLWPNPPSRRVRQPLSRASDEVMSQPRRLQEYIEGGTPLATSKDVPELESVFSLMAARYAQGYGLASIAGLNVPISELAVLESSIGRALSNIELPANLLARHAGISPLSMDRLLRHFARSSNPERFLVAPPESRDAAQSYAAALALVTEFLGGSFGNDRRQLQLGILITQWVRGLPLSYLISDRLRFARRSGTPNVPALIREVMTDVEQYARFQAPKYLACYLDVLRYHLDSLGIATRDENFLDVSMMLELGVSRPTEVSLMSLGLSRTSVIALSEYIVEDDLSPERALSWLRVQDLESLPLPELVRREIRTRLEAQSKSDGLADETGS